MVPIGRDLSPEYATLPHFPNWGLTILTAAEECTRVSSELSMVFRKFPIRRREASDGPTVGPITVKEMIRKSERQLWACYSR